MAIKPGGGGRGKDLRLKRKKENKERDAERSRWKREVKLEICCERVHKEYVFIWQHARLALSQCLSPCF